MRRVAVPILIVLCLCTLVAQSADIVVRGPTRPILLDELTKITATGFDQGQLGKVEAVWEPNEGVHVETGNLNSGEFLVLFRASLPGTYKVTFGQNLEHVEWSNSLKQALSSVNKSKVDPTKLSLLTEAAGGLLSTYPSKSGFCLVEVRTPPPPPPVIPPPPVVPPTPPQPPRPIEQATAITVVTVRVVADLNADHAEVLGNLRQWADDEFIAARQANRAPRYQSLEVAPNATRSDGTPDPRVAAYVRRIPVTARIPYTFVVHSRSDGLVILFEGELPTSADTIKTRVEQALNPRASTPLVPRGNGAKPVTESQVTAYSIAN